MVTKAVSITYRRYNAESCHKHFPPKYFFFKLISFLTLHRSIKTELYKKKTKFFHTSNFTLSLQNGRYNLKNVDSQSSKCARNRIQHNLRRYVDRSEYLASRFAKYDALIYLNTKMSNTFSFSNLIQK